MARNIRIKSVTGTNHRVMDVLLAETVPALGKQGDIVRVRAGYARNYLLTHGLATVATDHNRRMVAIHRVRQDDLKEAKVNSYRDLAEKISKYSVTMEANSNKDGHLYGSIVALDISVELRKAKFEVLPEHIHLDGPLKETGMYTVKVGFGFDIETEVKVWVVPKAILTPGK